MSIKTWKTRPAHFYVLDILKKKGAMKSSDLFIALTAKHKDLGLKDFNKLLMRLEIGRKLRMTSMSRGKKRIELLP